MFIPFEVVKSNLLRHVESGLKYVNRFNNVTVRGSTFLESKALFYFLNL